MFRFGLDLCNNLEEYKADECFGLMWCTLTRCCMELRQFQKAQQFCQMGLALIDGENRFALDVLKNYLPFITDALESLPTDIAEIRVNPVLNVGHELMFVYTTKIASMEQRDDAPLQPELIAVDLDKSQPVEQIFSYVYPEKVREWTQNPNALDKGGSVFQVPDTSYFVTAIPVLSEEDRRVLQSRLMCACLANTKIVLLKLDKADEPPTVDTKAYVAAVVKNAANCESMYGKGQKLADE